MPFGWFAVSYSDELSTGQVKTIRYFEREMVLWRDDSGVAHVNDPYCAHMGAHLGCGGKVVGQHLQCPFHGWQYDGSGAVKQIDYVPNGVPPGLAKEGTLPSWPTVEANNQIYVWYHPAGLAPQWEVEKFDVLGPGWVVQGRREWVIETHPLDIAENQADFPHFLYVHGTKEFPSYGDFAIDGHRRSAVARVNVETPRGTAELTVSSTGIGPGQGLTRFTGFCDVAIVASSTSITAGQTKLCFQYAEPAERAGSGMGMAMIKMVSHQLEQDIPIWNNKKYVHQSKLVSGDGPLLKLRKAFYEFYPK